MLRLALRAGSGKVADGSVAGRDAPCAIAHVAGRTLGLQRDRSRIICVHPELVAAHHHTLKSVCLSFFSEKICVCI